MDPKQHTSRNNTDITTSSDIASSNFDVVADTSLISGSSPFQPTSLQKNLAAGDRVPYNPGPKQNIQSARVSQHPDGLTDAVQDATLLWEKRGKNLTNDEANECVTNVVGFFKVLIEWDQDQREGI